MARARHALASPPNLVSLTRLVLAPCIVAALAVWGRGLATALFAVAVLTDWLDGFLARRLDMVSNAGRILDPVADKVVIDSVAVALACRGELPVWVAGLLVVRDIGIVAGALALSRGGGAVPASNTIGKIAFTVIGLMVLVHLADWSAVEPWTLWAGVGAAVVSAVSYARTGSIAGRKDAP